MAQRLEEKMLMTDMLVAYGVRDGDVGGIEVIVGDVIITEVKKNMLLSDILVVWRLE